MALVVVDDKSIVKIKTRNILLTKTCEQLKLKGLDAAAAEERARAMELRLYRGSSGSESYKHDALTLFKALKSRTLEQLDEAEAEETRRSEVEKRLRQEEEESTKIPPAKKQKLEELDAELAAKAKAEGLPEGYVTGYPLRDKVRAKITAGLKLVPERERQTAVRGKIVEEEVAAAVEQEMYTQLTDLKAYKTLARDIFANISAPDNSTFRRRVLTGEIGPSKFARLKPDDMASSARAQSCHCRWFRVNGLSHT
jgi:hypothetical protein